MKSLMTPYPHAQPCSDASTECSQSQQRRFGNSPLGAFRLLLVNDESKQRDQVDDDQICYEHGRHTMTLVDVDINSERLLLKFLDPPYRIAGKPYSQFGEGLAVDFAEHHG